MVTGSSRVTVDGDEWRRPSGSTLKFLSTPFSETQIRLQPDAELRTPATFSVSPMIHLTNANLSFLHQAKLAAGTLADGTASEFGLSSTPCLRFGP